MMTTSIRPAEKSLNLWKKFTRAINPFMLWLLNSQFHSLVSKWYTVITLTGRKSGNLYSIPVQYYQQGHVVMLLTSRNYQWWRNLLGGAKITLNLRGKPVTGYTSVSLNPDVVINVFGKLYPSSSLETREKFGDSGVVIYVTLDE